MSEPRHISACINEWLDGCPFNLPDALEAIRDERNEPTAASTERHAS